MDGGQNQLNANNVVFDKNVIYIVKNSKPIGTIKPTLNNVRIVTAINNNSPTIPPPRESGNLYQDLYNST